MTDDTNKTKCIKSMSVVKRFSKQNLFAGRLLVVRRIYYCSNNLFALKVSGYFCESFPLSLQKIRRLLVSDAECGVDLL